MTICLATLLVFFLDHTSYEMKATAKATMTPHMIEMTTSQLKPSTSVEQLTDSEPGSLITCGREDFGVGARFDIV
jgi:hypothetical protein